MLHADKFRYHIPSKKSATADIRRWAYMIGSNIPKQFQNFQYIFEAIWRLFNLYNKQALPSSCPFSPDLQFVYFNLDETQDIVTNPKICRADPIVLFALNLRDSSAGQYLYSEVPIHYRYVENLQVTTIR